VLPQLTQTLLGYDSETAGKALALGGLISIVLMPVSGFVTGRYVSPKWLMLGAFLEIFLALSLLSNMTLDVSFGSISFYRTLQVIALPFIFIPVSAICYVGVPPRNNGEASALMNQTRNIGGSVGLSMVGTIFAWRTQFHHARLAESITPYSSLHGMTVSQIAPVVQSQAVFMSYLDIFHFIALAALLVCPIVLLLKSPPKKAAQGASVGH
jgi:DHA2 family multidrug resistance protein